jgi:TatD DNase family protein
VSGPFFDAHNHLHHERLALHRDEIDTELARIPIGGAMVNGTCESDWPQVEASVQRHPFARASYGLHPWNVPRRSESWLETLREFLLRDPGAGLGEAGLDRWIEGCDPADQASVLAAQLDLASELHRPVTIHCVRAWGPLWELLSARPRLPRGFLLHAYGGPKEMVRGFIGLGAYLSFSPYFLHERKAAQREIFRDLPAERLLVETDAPDLRPPDPLNPRPLEDAAGQPIHHPANIDFTYARLAELRGCPLDELCTLAKTNFERLFFG